MLDATQIAWFRDTAHCTLMLKRLGGCIISHAPITRHYATLVYNAGDVRAVLKDYINGSSANKADVANWWSGHNMRQDFRGCYGQIPVMGEWLYKYGEWI